mmetsp:Transcript_50888/g.102042  ORF Transcript_50888/g.102042 Transcript_50888/m.102042 type:complete len:232 (-) Transcript_50888:72-767(-)
MLGTQEHTGQRDRQQPVKTMIDEHNGLGLLDDQRKAILRDNAVQQDLVRVCAEILEATVNCNDARRKSCHLKAFVGRTAPISPAQYVNRIAKYSECSPSCFVVACIYLQRLKDRNPKTYLTSKTFQRMFVVSAMVASKFLDDECCLNRRWAEIAGISTKELYSLEVEFLFRVGFELHVSRQEYDDYVVEVTLGSSSERQEAIAGGLSRVCSYTDVSEAPFVDPVREREWFS